MIFAYGYGCCVFKHNICGDHPELPDGMPDFSDPLPPMFFMNPKCPMVPIATDVTTTEVHQSKAVEEPEKNAPAGDVKETS